MDNIPLTYANYLILWILREPAHGYEIMKNIALKTNNLITVGPASMYRTLSSYQDLGFIQLVSEEDNKKKYQLTQQGEQLLQEQRQFMTELYELTREGE